MSEKNYYSAREAKAKTKIILIILWILLVSVLVTGTVLVVKNVSKLNEENSLDTNKSIQTYIHKNVLISISDSENENIAPQFLLIGFSGKDSAINVIELPETMNLTAPDRSGSLLELFNYGGIKYLSDAVANNYTISIDGYIGCTLSEIETIIDKLGGVDFTIGSKMLQKNTDGNLITNLVNGKQKLNGNQVCQFIRFDGWKDKAQKAQKRAELTTAVINEYSPFIESDTLVSIYNSVANKLDTNVSVIKMNDFSKEFKVFSKSDSPALIADVEYKNQSYDEVKIRKIFKY